MRVIHYWAVAQEQICMLAINPKSVKDTLTARETAPLLTYVKELIKDL